jgi:hypothetical protein
MSALRRRPNRWLLLAIVLLVLGALTSCVRWRPRNIQVSLEPDAVERGRYLGEHVLVCTTCHAQRDYARFGGPPAPGTAGLGGLTIPELFGTPRGLVIPAPNLSPTHLGDWTDGELFRAITGGVGRDGRSLFPGHPYSQYRRLPTEDIEAIVAWLRTLPPEPNELPERYLKYRSLESLLDVWPSPPPAFVPRPEPGSRRYGRDLLTASGCLWCHSPQTKLAFPIPGREYSGGAELPIPEPGGGTMWSTNLTPDPTGIGHWSRDLFIDRFKRSTPEVLDDRAVTPGGFNTLMPWGAYSGMTEEDLGHIYDALMRRRPIEHLPPRWTPPQD